MSAGGETSLTSEVPIRLYNQVRHVPLNRSDCGSTLFQINVLYNLNSLRHSVYRRSRLNNEFKLKLEKWISLLFFIKHRMLISP